MTDLKPCPFCGGEAYLSSYAMDERFAYAEQVSVGCKACAVGFSRCDDQNPKGGYALNGTAKPIVISQWNTRATPTLSAAMELPEVRALIEALAPFADQAETFDSCGKEFVPAEFRPAIVDHTIGDLRKARAALAPFTGDKP
jgi:hypothetical protein